LCIIPARKGSKRLENKNMALLNGKPLVEYAIEVAVESKLFALVIVSSDSREILELAYEHFHGGLVQPHKRPSGLAGDDIEIKTVCRFILETYRPCEEFCLLQPSNPFRTAEDIKSAYKLLMDTDANYVMSVKPYSHPPQWALSIQDKYIKPYWDKETIKQSQDLEPLYVCDGGIIFAKVKAFLGEFNLGFYGSKAMPYFLKQSVDIDTAEDLAYAEYLMSKNEG